MAALRRVRVASVVSSRYPDGFRPLSWDERRDGIDVIRTTEGAELRLRSDGGQSAPKAGWEIVLSDGDAHAGYRWTLYGIAQPNAPKAHPA